MFSKAKRFESLVPPKSQKNHAPDVTAASASYEKKQNSEKQKLCTKICNENKVQPAKPSDMQSQGSSVKSVKSFVTPKAVSSKICNKPHSSNKKPISSTNKKNTDGKCKISDDIVKAQEVEIRNKNYTISECNKHIEELKHRIACLQNQRNEEGITKCDISDLNINFFEMTLDSNCNTEETVTKKYIETYTEIINNLTCRIHKLEHECNKLEQEVSNKQVELTSLEAIITIRDSLCKDLQDKLTNVESNLEDTNQRLAMVKGHHSLALEANESIRKEYKTEIETMKSKLEEEKQSIVNKYKTEQEKLKSMYNNLMENIKNQCSIEKEDAINELKEKLISKDLEIKAKLEQINEATQEKLKLCEIQFEERSRNIQVHWSQQEKKVQYLENEISELKKSVFLSNEQNASIQNEISSLKNDNEKLKSEKLNLLMEVDKLKDDSKKKRIEYENEINKLVAKVDQVKKEKNKFEMSLSITRDIVQVLTMRLRESDGELEDMQEKLQALTNEKDALKIDLDTCKSTLNNTALECSEYKEALVNILKSKAALAKEHTRIMEHNVTLIESLQNVEKEAYRELGSIKSELIEDVEMLKKESESQIQMLRDEVEKKRVLCEMAREHASAATAAAEQSRTLLGQAAVEIARLEAGNQQAQLQIQDQQSLVVELSLLRQENEELTMTVAKQSSVIDKMKNDINQVQLKPKSPSARKSHKIGKENLQVVSPLRERNY